MVSSHKDVMVLTMAIANNYEARRRQEREHWVHPYIAEIFDQQHICSFMRFIEVSQ
jgi:hypothetical protein